MIINRPDRPAGLYIHIPFCLKKCKYCAFLSSGDWGEQKQAQYIEALKKELLLYERKKRKIDTIFIGGGTPSLLQAQEITDLLKAAEAAFSFSQKVEITIEANPKTLTLDKLYAYHEAGINRLSMGAQSMDNNLLTFMGRAHDREDFLDNYSAARKAGFDNINIDLMFGIPGQRETMWLDTLKQVLELEPEHLSFYSLQLEEGTEFYQLYRSGKMDLPPVEVDRSMYHKGIGMLKAAGYEHYEISNCAKPGFQCRHNLKYWNFDEYAAAGLGAHSFLYDQGRRCNVSHMQQYIDLVEKGEFPIDAKAYESEALSDYMAEYVFTALRRCEGLDTADFQRTFQKDFFQVYGHKIESLKEYREQGLLCFQDGRLWLTEKGIDCSNDIMAEFV